MHRGRSPQPRNRSPPPRHLSPVSPRTSREVPRTRPQVDARAMRALLIPLGSDLYAVDMRAVREVVAAPRATQLPGGPANVLGVFNLRGEIVPLFDTALLLGLPSASRGAFAVVIDSALGPAGLVATDAPESVE